MPRGKAGKIAIRGEDGGEVVGERVRAECVLPEADVAELRTYAKETGEGYAAMMERVLREALAPLVQTAHEAKQSREAVLREKEERAHEVDRLLRALREEKQQLDRELRRRGG